MTSNLMHCVHTSIGSTMFACVNWLWIPIDLLGRLCSMILVVITFTLIRSVSCNEQRLSTIKLNAACETELFLPISYSFMMSFLMHWIPPCSGLRILTSRACQCVERYFLTHNILPFYMTVSCVCLASSALQNLCWSHATHLLQVLYSRWAVLEFSKMQNLHRQHCLWACSMWYVCWPIMYHLDRCWELQQAALAAYECLCFQFLFIVLNCFGTSYFGDKIMLTIDVLAKSSLWFSIGTAWVSSCDGVFLAAWFKPCGFKLQIAFFINLFCKISLEAVLSFLFWSETFNGVTAVVFIVAFLAALFCPLWSAVKLELLFRIVSGLVTSFWRHSFEFVQVCVSHLVVLECMFCSENFHCSSFLSVPYLGLIKWRWTAFAISNFCCEITLDALYLLLYSIQ